MVLETTVKTEVTEVFGMGPIGLWRQIRTGEGKSQKY